MNNYMNYQRRYSQTAEENILLCWENHAVPLPNLIKSTSRYECNMLEYYRYIYIYIFKNLDKIQKNLILIFIKISIEFIFKHVFK